MRGNTNIPLVTTILVVALVVGVSTYKPELVNPFQAAHIIVTVVLVALIAAFLKGRG